MTDCFTTRRPRPPERPLFSASSSQGHVAACTEASLGSALDLLLREREREREREKMREKRCNNRTETDLLVEYIRGIFAEAKNWKCGLEVRL